MISMDSGSALYYAADTLGSSRVIVQSTGTLCYDADFTPFGGEKTQTSTCAQNYKFEGKERDTETGNDDFGARYYSWRFGRWLSSDWSAVPVPVPYANLTNPQTLNLYSMVADDPESFADLDGHEETATPAAAAPETTVAPPAAAPPQSQIDAVVERTLQISEAGVEKGASFLADAAGNLAGAFAFVLTVGVGQTATNDVARDPRDNGKTCSVEPEPHTPQTSTDGAGAKKGEERSKTTRPRATRIETKWPVR